MSKIKTTNKRAFTLTELLIVVIVIGVLSAVTLPKFNRVIENRKVTEAEEMMSAVRTEQERRCTLDQNYTTNFSALSDVIASANTKNYTYSLQSQGISARSNGGDYTLKILSYEDGSYCCTGDGCKKLNKNYPDCATLNFPTSNCAGTEGETTPPGTEPTPVEPEEPECVNGQVTGNQVCNGCGTQTTKACVGGKWVNSLGACSKTAEECEDPGEDDKKCELTAVDCLKSGQIINGEECKCVACPEGTTTKDGYTCGNDSTCDDSKKDNCTSTDGTWNDETCGCTCPANKNKILAADGKCVSKFKAKEIDIKVLANFHYCPNSGGWGQLWRKPCKPGEVSTDCYDEGSFDSAAASCSPATSKRDAPCYIISYEYYVGGSLAKIPASNSNGGQEDHWLVIKGGTRIGGEMRRYPGGSMPSCYSQGQSACDQYCDASKGSCDYKCLISKNVPSSTTRYKYCFNKCAPTRYTCNNREGTGRVLTCVL